MKILFPEELTRLQYLIRWLIFFVIFLVVDVLLFYTMPKAFGVPNWLQFVIIVPLLFMRVPCLDIPRLRSIGWSPWLVLLLLIPFINLIFQLVLFTMPPDNTETIY
jgi:uncharacterized membrane protein YhaH (DUF805 family)